jgi:glutamine amidotransferase
MIGVIDYGIGNLRSAQKALIKVGADAVLIGDPDQLKTASGIVLPGVGSFGRCADALLEGGWIPEIQRLVNEGLPFLGICVGFQLLYERSDESPGSQGLGLLGGSVSRLSGEVRLPQIQWNQIVVRRDNRLLEPCDPAEWMYFVHSFAPPVSEVTVATCAYGEDVSAAIERENLFGAQFHPEKSGSAGLSYLRRFAEVVEGS